jgi:quaternary ammonium compound-resistance protein SugE
MEPYTMAWLILLAAGGFEVAATTAFRYTENFTRLWPTVVFALTAVASMLLLQRSLSGIPLGTAYAVWTGIGAAGTTLIGLWLFQEPATTMRLVLLCVLIGSIIGLKLAGTN